MPLQMQYQIRPLKNAASIDHGTGASVILLWDCPNRDRNLAQEIQGCLTERPRGVRKSRKEFPGQRICRLGSSGVRLGAWNSPFTRPNRRKSVRFPIMRCNPLSAWVLCSSLPRAAVEIVRTIYDSAPRQHNSRHYANIVNSLVHGCLQHFLDIPLALGTGFALLLCTN
jgi:hypothetical protein